MLFFKLLSRLPLGVLYLFSDFLYLLARYIIRYRKKVIDENLLYAFPEKSEKERKVIRNRFYRNFTDSIAETVKTLTISKEELAQRFTITNQELLDQEVKNGKSVLLLAGHFFNWELGLQRAAVLSQVPSEGVYLKINNPFFDKLMYQIRTRFGNTITEKRDFRNTVKTLTSQHRVVQLAADQRPNNRTVRYQRPFLNRPAYFFEGAENIAKSMDLPVYFGEITKKGRGRYQATYELLSRGPYASHEEHSITDAFCERLEANIRLQPDLYLWSHKRWKV
ncbi:lysophospholipid acyltransferase family protein [Algoriphagus sp. AK58]|uniref:lysophospholipid acyltransferase family protein n=1 Tax=Algoriphagus sp. AK58 TaxID=1406877 RepID=UPI0016507F87|nr:lysophospholipid acyltransferase family protein [Algoriphagus sp. AK58]MBC6367232.1 lipid A biosynthesis acyltransferase [Algoriphagus sp. AK58]